MTTTMTSCVGALFLTAWWAATASAQENLRVPLLFTEDSSTPNSVLILRGLRDSLGSSPNVRVEPHHLLYTRLADEQFDDLADWLRLQYGRSQVPVVVAEADPASDFAMRYGKSVWPHSRMMHINVSVARAPAIAEMGHLAISRFDPYQETAEQALLLFPETRQIWVIAGASDRDRQWLAVTKAGLAPLRDRVRIKEIAGRAWLEILAEFSRMPDDAIALLSPFFVDAHGRSFIPVEAIKEIARRANRPVFVEEEPMMGTGAIGGYMQDWEAGGRVLGQTILRLLAGESTIPQVQIVPGHWVFDAIQLRRWNISESRLPGGSLVINREESIWPRYRGPILATIGLVVLQAVVIGGLLVQRRQRRRAEVALRDSEERARTSVREVRDLAGRLISARETERARIARDLHDDIGQRVASFSIALTRVKPQVSNAPGVAVQSLAELEQQAMQLSTDLRHVSHELHPATLEHLGLLEALRERCDEFRQESGVPVRLEISESWRDVQNDVGLCLYRVAQEALRNVATHARAQRATVSLDRQNGYLVMRVTDDGCGFDATARSRTGLGLISIGECVRMLGGALDVMSAGGAGTCVVVHLPTEASHAV